MQHAVADNIAGIADSEACPDFSSLMVLELRTHCQELVGTAGAGMLVMLEDLGCFDGMMLVQYLGKTLAARCRSLPAILVEGVVREVTLVCMVPHYWSNHPQYEMQVGNIESFAVLVPLLHLSLNDCGQNCFGQLVVTSEFLCD